MADQAMSDSKYHVLLIGVDDYPAPHALAGCVNDVDAMQSLLLGDRVRLRPDDICRLTSPLPGSSHETAVPEKAATLANIREALAELGSDKVSSRDRVFIYYSGHGTWREVTTPDGIKSHREALVPKDYDTQGLLFDHEINELLRAIVARTSSVTAVLDCCFAAGATRAQIDAHHQRPRYLDPTARPGGHRAPPPVDRASPPPGRAPRFRGEQDDRGVGSIDDCHVVSACMNHEVAREDASGDKQHGLLTRAFLAALDAATDADLRTMTWSRIWHAMRADVRKRNPMQTPWMAGELGRIVLAGPPVKADPGFPVLPVLDGYQIEAGTLAGVTRGAVLAVYGEQPDRFPVIDSDDDRTYRVGRVRVTEADRGSATAVLDGPPFRLPSGARGRLVVAGQAARLTCAVVARDPDSATRPVLEARLRESPLLELVDPGAAEVKLEERDGRWFVTDAMHGTRDDEYVLASLQGPQLARAREVLEHYHAYARPLRMAALIDDLPGALELRVLACPAGKLSGADAQSVALPEAPSRGTGTYAVQAGARVCFEVRNRSPHGLRVTLVNSAASGKVQMLGDQTLAEGVSYRFWLGNDLGSPFPIAPPQPGKRCIDRLIAIGRTDLNHDLSYLRLDRTFAQVIDVMRNTRDMGDPPGPPRPLERWAAAQAVIQTDPRPAAI